MTRRRLSPIQNFFASSWIGLLRMAALQQVSVSHDEAAENLGATKRPTIQRIDVPLMVEAFSPTSSSALSPLRLSFPR